MIDLKARHNIVDVKYCALITQLTTTKAALGSIADIMKSDVAIQAYGQFFGDLRIAVYGCETMVLALETRLAGLTRNKSNSLTIWSKIGVIWDSTTTDNYLAILNNQINALTLLLTALQWYVYIAPLISYRAALSNDRYNNTSRNVVECNSLLADSASRSLVERVKDDASSLLWLFDAESLGSHRSLGTQDLGTFDAQFDFDDDIFTSRVYRAAMRSNIIFAVKATSAEIVKDDNISDWSLKFQPGLKITRRFSIQSERLSDAIESLSIRNNSQLSPHSTLEGESRDMEIQTVSDYNQEYGPGLNDGASAVLASDMSIFQFDHHSQDLQSSSFTWMSPAESPLNSTRVLLLGGCRSGKSTLIKSLMGIFGHFDIATRRMYLEPIIDNTIESILTLVEARSGPFINEASQQAYRIVSNYRLSKDSRHDQHDVFQDGRLPQHIGSAIAILWSEPNVRLSLVSRERIESGFSCVDSVE